MLKASASDIKIAAGYIRESTDDQLEFSPDAQRKALYKYAGQNGYYLDDQYIYVEACDIIEPIQKTVFYQRFQRIGSFYLYHKSGLMPRPSTIER